MEQKELAALSDQELVEAQKKAKSNSIISAVLIGCLVGVAVYSAVKNGFGFFTFFPLFFVYILVVNGKKTVALTKELKSRNLK